MAASSLAKNIRIVLLGAPGSGKGTYGKELAKHLNVEIFSTGDIIRKEIDSGSNFGNELKHYSSKGLLAPDELVTNMLLEKINLFEKNISNDEIKKRNGFILDGFPRSLNQAERLDAEIGGLSGVINVCLDEDIILQKLLGRRVCSKCNKSFSTASFVNEEEGYDMPALLWPEKCSSYMKARVDDKRDIILSRLQIYKDETMPLINYYEQERNILKVFEVKKGLKDLPKLYQIIEDMI
eukprot:g3413.t1